MTEIAKPAQLGTARNRVRVGALFLVVFVAAVGAIMLANTRLLGLGDPKWGPDGWLYYWPMWVAFYTPVALSVLAQSLRLPEPALWRFFGPLLAVLVVTIEVSFLLDHHWRWLVVESIFIFAVSEVLVRSHRAAA